MTFSIKSFVSIHFIIFVSFDDESFRFDRAFILQGTTRTLDRGTPTGRTDGLEIRRLE